jgi:hypothetical protein
MMAHGPVRQVRHYRLDPARIDRGPVDHPFYRSNSPAIATLISPLLQWRPAVSAAAGAQETGRHCGKVKAVATTSKALRRAGNSFAEGGHPAPRR